jgi:hypothetical protein
MKFLIVYEIYLLYVSNWGRPAFRALKVLVGSRLELHLLTAPLSPKKNLIIEYNDPYYADSTGISAEGDTLSFDIAIYTTGVDSFEVNLLNSAEDPTSLYYYESAGSETVDFETNCSFTLADYDLKDLFGLEFVLTSVAYDDIADTVDAQFTVSNVQTTSAVPLPASFLLLGSGLIWLKRQHRKSMG